MLPFFLSQLADLSLPGKTVSVWVLDDTLIEPACSALERTLSPDERGRARAYRQEKHRNRFVARRGVLRWLIGACLSCNPESLRFNVTPFGQLVLLGSYSERLAFSISQTDGMALLALAWDCRVGVDVERRIDGLDMPGIGRGIFSATEQKMLDAARPDSTQRLLKLWTRKEALLKALGTGLAGEPDAYATEDDALLGESHWRASHQGSRISGWTFLDLPVGPQFQGALAVSLEDARVALRLYPVLRRMSTETVDS